MNEQLRVGDILDTSFRVFRENLKLMLGLTGLTAVGAALLQVPAVWPILSGNPAAALSPLYWVGVIAAGIAVFFLTATVEGAITWAAFAGLRGQKETAGGCFRKARSLMGPLAGTVFVVAMLTGLQFLLCLVPGFIAMARYAVAFPAVIIEGQKTGSAINRSRQLTTGSRGKVLLTLVVAGIIVLIITLALRIALALALGLSAFAMFSTQAGQTVANALLSVGGQFITVLLLPLSTIPCVVLFMTLRDLKEGAELEHKIDQLVGSVSSQDAQSRPSSF